ncbi:hypothetical protein CLOM_g409 [Closterium sp. NIES-68]|nr:hypothetical protein CLOM_g409 [Closterium sp. NIES-68]
MGRSMSQPRLRASAFCSLSCARTLVLPSVLLFTVLALFNRHFRLLASPFSKSPLSSRLISVPSSAVNADGAGGADSASNWLRSVDSRKLLPLANRLEPEEVRNLEETVAFLPRYSESRSEHSDEAVASNETINFNIGDLAKPRDPFLSIPGQPEEGGSVTEAGSNGQREQLSREPEWDSEGYVSASTLGQLAQEASINGTVVILVCSYGYADFLLNWAVYAGELGYGRQFLVFAEDRESFDLLRHRFPRQVVRWHVPEIEQAREDELKGAGLVEENGSTLSGSTSSSSGRGGRDGSGEGSSSSSSSSSKDAFSFLTLGFKRLMYRRVAYIRTLLNMGFNVLICDSDFIWVKDPFPYLFAKPSPSELSRRSMASRLALSTALGVYSKKKRAISFSDFESQASPTSGAAPVEYDVVGVREFPDTYNFYATATYLMDPRPEKLDHAKLCGGFVLFRNTPGGRLVLELLIMKIYRAPKVTGRENDQLYLGMAIHELLKVNPAPLIGVLPQTLFPPGWLYFQDSSALPPGRRRVLPDWDAVVTIHNNWMAGKGNKLDRFVTAGLWRLTDAKRDL